MAKPRLVKLICLLALICASMNLRAQSALDAITFTWVDVDNSANDYTATSSSTAGQDIDANVSYDIFFSRSTTTNNNRVVSGYTIGGTSYSFLLDPDTLALRRVGSATRLSLWIEAETAVDNTNDDIFIAPERQVPERSLYQANLLNYGYDNVLVNSGTNASNIERIDAIYRTGMLTATPANAIIPVMDRGANGEFKIAMITSLDANGDPASYGNLVEVTQADFGAEEVTFSLSILFLQQALGENPIPTGSSTQGLGGVGISFADLGISANEIVYGYSLFSVDVNTTDHDLTDISTFPTNSNNSGLDLAAGAVSAISSDGQLVKATGPGGYKAALTTWLKANDGAFVSNGGAASTEGGSVGFWEDQSLGGHDYATLGTAPTFRSTSSTINFNPTVDFLDGSETGLSTGNNSDYNSGGAPYTRKGINIAFRTTSNSTNLNTKQQLFEEGGGTNGLGIYIRNSTLHMSVWNKGGNTQGDWNDSGSAVETVSVALSTDTEYIVTMEFEGDAASAGGGSIKGYLNGELFGTLTTPFGQNIGLLYDHSDGIGLGQHNNASLYDDNATEGDSFYGEIAEFIYCSEPGSFASSTRNQIESYLAIKYGITLDQSSPINYVNSNGDVIFNTTNAASIGGYLEYNNDIAGIGRDDESELDQPASKSENAGSVVTIDKGATISTDDTWLIWGNDGAALTETSALTMPDTIDSRLNRVWRVAEENDVQSTSISFDLTGLGLSSNANNFSLLVAGNSSNADFSSATVVTGGTFNGDVLTFTGVDFSDGQYFTLGTDFSICSPGGVENNLLLWLQADSEVFNTGTTLATDGQTISGWGDQSINSNDAADGSNLTTFQTNEVNFNPAVSFADVATSLQGTITTSNTGLNFFLIGNYNSASGTDKGFFEFRNTSPSSRNFFMRQRYGGSNNFASSVAVDSWNLWTIEHPSGSTVDIFENSGTFESGYTTTNSTSPTGTYNYTLGDDDTGGNRITGFIGEIIVYDGTLTATEKQRVESYLAIKYGITLDQTSATDYLASDGGTIWEAAVNASYNNDIAGIGRDDASCHEQKQSISQNSDAIVTVGLGSIAADNSSNASSFATDDSFLVWGNDNGATNFAGRTTGITTIGTVTERMTRIWRVDENTDVGTTSISFDLASLGYGTTLSDFQLIVSDNSDLSSATLYQAASINGDVVTFSGINLTDGQYFTLGTDRSSCGPGGVTTDLYNWLRADAGTSTTVDNTALSTWSDQSGSGTDATTNSVDPLFKNNTTDNINFNPTVDFDAASGHRLDLGNLSEIKSGATNGGDYTLIGVGLRGSSSGVNYIYGSEGGTGNQDLHFGYRNNTAATIAHWGNDMDVSVTAFDAPTAPFIVFAEYDGNGRILEEIRDGNLARNTDSNTTDISGSKTNYLGDVNSLNNYDGLISEAIIFSNDITDLQKQQVYSYLGLKYGITLPTDADNDATPGETISGSVTEGDYVASDGSTIIWDYSANTTYHNDVAGIGRDDASCWQQKQGTAEDSDDILTMGLGSIATTNGDNLNTFNDDLDYLIWGNDNGATGQASANTSDVPSTVSERMARVWRVEDTGAVGATELQFDLTDLNYSSTASDFSLIVSNTSTMADGSLITGGTLNGNVLSFTGVDLIDGQYFTLATANVACGPGGVNSDLALWLRADIGVFSDAGVTAATDGANALQWNDQSSASNNASESNNGGGSPVEPTFETNEINFNPVIRFSDAQSTNNSWLQTGSNSTSAAMSLISVFQTGQNNGSASNFTDSPALISGEAANSNDYALGLGEARLYINAADNDTYNARSTPTYNDQQPYIGTATRLQATSAGSIQLYVNSESVATGVSTNTTLNSASTFALGNHSVYDVDGQYEGDIAEAIVFNKVLSETEQARVETYLALKYGITRVVSGLSESAEDYLAGDGGIIWDIDNQSSTYHNDIFGIGRDDLSCFEQTQSKSENSDALVTFNLSGGFGTDDSFLISGNDNAAIEAEGNTERPATINSRLNREWRVQETGTVGTVELTYDLSTITGPLGVGTNNLSLVRLMVDDDGDFSTGATLIEPASINGNTVTFNVDFTSGQYYTLGSTEIAALPVNLLSFTAEPVDQEYVQLNWITASEVNNAYFTIERSSDAVTFEPIGTRDGAGTSEEINYYEFVDHYPPAGTSYYRLRQTDFNGTVDYSEISRVYFQGKQDVSDFKLYPNPVNKGEVAYIGYQSSTAQRVSVTILSASGSQQQQFNAQLSPAASYLEISTTYLSKGLHFVRIQSESGEARVLKLLVQ